MKHCYPATAALPLAYAVWSPGTGRPGGQAPEQPSAGAYEALRTPVRIKTEPTTARRLTAQIATQAVVQIDVAEDIADRQFIVAVDRAPADTVLQALCDLYDWRLRKLGPRAYRLSRRIARGPAAPGKIPAAMQAALPVDLRAFLRLPDLAVKEPGERTSNAAGFRLIGLSDRALARIRDALLPKLLEGKRVTVRDMPEPARRDLLLDLLLDRMGDTAELLHGDFAAHSMLLDRVFIKLEDTAPGLKHIFVEVPPEGNSGFGFGASLPQAR